MIWRPVRFVVSAFVSFAVAWVVFMVPFGRYTLFEHARRIASTDEAQELGGAMGEAGERLRGEVTRQVGAAVAPDAGTLRDDR